VRIKGVRIVAALLVVTVLTLTVGSTGWAENSGATPASGASSYEDRSQGTPGGAGLGVASLIATIPYGALKVAFAVVGGVVGGMTYVFSGGNEDAAKSVWTTTMYGTYVLTPEHLRGDRPVRFLGIAEEPSSKESRPAEPAPAK
jgi:hypothetical protein